MDCPKFWKKLQSCCGLASDVTSLYPLNWSNMSVYMLQCMFPCLLINDVCLSIQDVYIVYEFVMSCTPVKAEDPSPFLDMCFKH